MKTLYFITCLFMLCLCSCTRYYYCPNAMNVPLLSKEKQARVVVSTGASDEVNNTNYQLAYSPLQHLGIMANYTSYKGESKASASLREFGAGYYYSDGGKAKLVLDVYGGFGGGYFHSDVNMNFQRFFVQPGIGLRTKYFDMAFNIRVCAIKYTQFDANGQSLDYLEQQHLIDADGIRIDSKAHTFIESAFTLRGGSKHIKLQVQFLGVNAVGYIPWKYESGLTSVGIYVGF